MDDLGVEFDDYELAALELYRHARAIPIEREDQLLLRILARVEVENDEAVGWEPAANGATPRTRTWTTVAIASLAFAAGMAATWGLRGSTMQPESKADAHSVSAMTAERAAQDRSVRVDPSATRCRGPVIESPGAKRPSGDEAVTEARPPTSDVGTGDPEAGPVVNDRGADERVDDELGPRRGPFASGRTWSSSRWTSSRGRATQRGLAPHSATGGSRWSPASVARSPAVGTQGGSEGPDGRGREHARDGGHGYGGRRRPGDRGEPTGRQDGDGQPPPPGSDDASPPPSDPNPDPSPGGDPDDSPPDDEPSPEEDEAAEGDCSAHTTCLQQAEVMCESEQIDCAPYVEDCDLAYPDCASAIQACEMQFNMCAQEIEVVCAEIQADDPEFCEGLWMECSATYDDCVGVVEDHVPSEDEIDVEESTRRANGNALQPTTKG